MADISMCNGGDCPAKEYCYRFKAPINEYRQSYFQEIPMKAHGMTGKGDTIVYCDYFMEYWKNQLPSNLVYRRETYFQLI